MTAGLAAPNLQQTPISDSSDDNETCCALECCIINNYTKAMIIFRANNFCLSRLLLFITLVKAFCCRQNDFMTISLVQFVDSETRELFWIMAQDSKFAVTTLKYSDSDLRVRFGTERDNNNQPCNDKTTQSLLPKEEKALKTENIENESVCESSKPRIRLFSFEDAPAYLRFNPYILSGYRGLLSTKLCIESIFWWTNETINIWSHIFGLLLFTGLAINDVVIINIDAPFGDKVIVVFILFCFQVCMFLSALYHTFSCRSEHDYDNFLCFDLFGIALALYAVYISGIYYAYWCNKDWGNFYMLSVTFIFMIAMIIQIPKLNIDGNVKMLVFVAWALYGVVPTFHWFSLMGGYANPLVEILLPRVIGMYTISGTAFLIYLTKIPERFFPGKVDYIGHSHQWWHMFILMALYYWHNSGMIYVQYRMNHACHENMNIL